jgi:hypothetical protein
MSICGFAAFVRDDDRQPGRKFRALPHPDQRYGQTGTPTPAALANKTRYKEKLGSGAELFNAVGLDTLKFMEVWRQKCTLDGKELPHIVHHQVSWSI